VGFTAGPERWSAGYIGRPRSPFATGRLARSGALVSRLHRPPPLSFRHRPACPARSAGQWA